MTYAIGQIVFGIDLQEPSSYSGMADIFAEFRDEIVELRDLDVPVASITGQKHASLITSQYSGNGDEPLYFGIGLGEIDEVHTIIGDELIKLLTPNSEQRNKYQLLLEFLEDQCTPALYEKMRSLEPYVFITWGSS